MSNTFMNHRLRSVSTDTSLWTPLSSVALPRLREAYCTESPVVIGNKFLQVAASCNHDSLAVYNSLIVRG